MPWNGQTHLTAEGQNILGELVRVRLVRACVVRPQLQHTLSRGEGDLVERQNLRDTRQVLLEGSYHEQDRFQVAGVRFRRIILRMTETRDDGCPSRGLSALGLRELIQSPQSLEVTVVGGRDSVVDGLGRIHNFSFVFAFFL